MNGPSGAPFIVIVPAELPRTELDGEYLLTRDRERAGGDLPGIA